MKVISRVPYADLDGNRVFSVHAECAALKDVSDKKLLEKASLIVVRRSIHDNVLMKSTPCPKCEASLIRNKIKKVYYMEADTEI